MTFQPVTAFDLSPFSSDEINAGIDNVVDGLRAIWKPRPSVLVSEYASVNRVLPEGTPFPGPWRNELTPYLIEPMDNMSATSPIQRTIIAKGAQLGFTAAAENVTVYWMDVSPAEILFISATEELLKRWVSKRLEPAIDSCGMRPKIADKNSNPKQRRSGDRTFSKEYPGGSLDMASAQAAASLRSDSKRVLIRDEIDGAPSLLRTGEGNWLKVSYVRTNAWGNRRKVLDFSTPTTFEESAIWPAYLDGDQRKFEVPCPFCGAYQFLIWDGGKSGGGLRWTLDGKRVKDVWYQCEHCGEAIKNYHKSEMLKSGRWKATAISESETVRSYHLSSIYSPVGMLSWEELVSEYLKAQDDPDGMRSFVNLYLGEPYRETGQRPKVEKVVELRTGYKSGTIPSNEILFLTAAVDVQKGSKRDQKNNPARLEVEVCGHGAGYRSWSIAYFRIEGSIDDPFDGAWAKLTNLALDHGFEFERADGMKFAPMITVVDSGDGTLIDTVYQFASGWQNTYACAGFDLLKKKKDKLQGIDEIGRSNIDRYRLANLKHDTPVLQISTNYYKNHIYHSLAIRYQPGVEQQKPGFCAFPQDYPRRYFEMLTAEEKRTDGSFYCPSGRRNEALDLRVYNLAARDFYIDEKVKALREYWKQKGHGAEQLKAIRSPHVLRELAARVRPKV